MRADSTRNIFFLYASVGAGPVVTRLSPLTVLLSDRRPLTRFKVNVRSINRPPAAGEVTETALDMVCRRPAALRRRNRWKA